MLIINRKCRRRHIRREIALSELTAIALICTLTPSPETSSSELMAGHVLSITSMARNAAHLSRQLRAAPYPADA
jgi:hypothetical protein